MKAIHRRRLRKLAAYLAGPVARADAKARKKGRFKFYMGDWSTWNSSDDWGKRVYCPTRVGLSKNMYNTAACALGWATNIFPEVIFGKKYGSITMKSNKHLGPSEVAEKFFGLAPAQTDQLFYDSTNNPKDKAAQIRKIAAAR